MRPVWTRYYGVIPMTKFGYLVALGVAALVAILFFVAAALAGFMPPLSTLWQPDPIMAQRGAAGLFYNYMYWVLLVCLVAQAIDTVVTLRVFAKKEAEQRAMLEELDAEDPFFGDKAPRSSTSANNHVQVEIRNRDARS